MEEIADKDFMGVLILYSGKSAPFGKDLWAGPYHALWQ